MPKHTDALSSIRMPRAQRDRLRRGVLRAAANCPDSMTITITAGQWEIREGEPATDVEAALATLTRELRR